MTPFTTSTSPLTTGRATLAGRSQTSGRSSPIRRFVISARNSRRSASPRRSASTIAVHHSPVHGSWRPSRPTSSRCWRSSMRSPTRTARRRRRPAPRRRPSATPPSASSRDRARTALRRRPTPDPATVADANRAGSTAPASAPTAGAPRAVEPSHASPTGTARRLRIGGRARSRSARSRPSGAALGFMKPNM